MYRIFTNSGDRLVAIRKILIGITLVTAFVVLQGCATPVHMSKSVDQASRDKVLLEIAKAENWIPKHIDDDDAERKILEIYSELLPSATEICRQVGEDECGWDIQYSSELNVNAFASGESVIVIQKGILRHAENDDEIAMVIAHEISHHAANHIAETKQNAEVGQIVGGILVGALAGAAYTDTNYSDNYGQYQIINAVDSGMAIGGLIGGLSFSKDQEYEADYIGAHILYKGGYDPIKAREIWVKLARLGSTEHGERHSFNTHPDPADRLARFDNTIIEIESGNGLFGNDSNAMVSIKDEKNEEKTSNN